MHPPFVAPRGLLANPHVQTIAAAAPLWAPPRAFTPARAESLRIALARGGALHAWAWSHAGPRPAAIVVHGVGGSSESRYVVRAAVSLYRAGLHVVRLDLRGAGRSVVDAPALYHAGLTEDLRAAVAFVAERATSVALVGFSLGGHVALRLAGEIGEGSGGALRAVVAVSAPLDLARVVRAIERPRNLVYRGHVLHGLVRQADAFARAHPDRAAYERRSLRRLRTIRAYDERVIAPMHGFASADDYYERASAGPLVDRIRLPSLLVHAEDDPLVPADSVRPWLRAAPAALDVVWTPRGGHVGWFAGLDESSWVDTWVMQRARTFLSAHV